MAFNTASGQGKSDKRKALSQAPRGRTGGRLGLTPRRALSSAPRGRTGGRLGL